MRNYDLIVIGSGPAGQRAAIQAAKSGSKVALVEKREVMGASASTPAPFPARPCARRCCICPAITYQNIYGVNYRVKEKISMADLAFRVQHVISTEIDVTLAQLTRNDIEVLVGMRQLSRSAHRCG